MSGSSGSNTARTIYSSAVIENPGMIQGTTPTHIFRLPIDTGSLDMVRITYAQNGSTVLEARETDVSMEGSEIRYRLRQEDTMGFNPRYPVEVQLKVLTRDGNVLASKVISITVSKILNTEVLG